MEDRVSYIKKAIGCWDKERALRQNKTKLATELNSLGFFQGKRKKEIQAEIETMEKELASVMQLASETQKKATRLALEYDGADCDLENGQRYVSWDEVQYIRTVKKLGLDEPQRIILGQYPQFSDSPEPIAWRILDRNTAGTKVLVLSEHALENVPFNAPNEGNKWETSSLNKWLNDTFLNTAFKEEERAIIDYATCLSKTEVESLLLKNGDARCLPTEHALSAGANSAIWYCSWQLRTPNEMLRDFAYVVDQNGKVNPAGIIGIGDILVRPALWLKVERN